MIESRSGPIPRRRLWWAASGLLAVSFIGGWWFFPRGDARLVGRWAIHSKAFDEVPVVEFDWHGRGECRSGGRVRRFPWRVEGDRLIVGVPSNSLIVWVNGLHESWTTPPASELIPVEETMAIRFTGDPSTIVIGDDEGGLTLKRITD